jgi:hypothetical protein
MINDLYASLTAREQRALRWSAAATAAVLWLSTAWADPWILLTVPLIGGAYAFFVARSRSHGEDDRADDDADWDY